MNFESWWESISKSLPDGPLKTGMEQTAKMAWVRSREGMQECQKKKIFSGECSCKMWNVINSAETVEDLKYALYTVCCRLQELEDVVVKRDKSDEKDGE